MRNRFTLTRLSIPVCLALAVSGCGSLDLWPFGGDKVLDRSGRPSNATQYVCNGGKSFYVHMLDNGSAAWVIYPDREVRFEKVGATSGARYSNGIAVLDINGNQAALQDGPAISFTDCKAVGK